MTDGTAVRLARWWSLAAALFARRGQRRDLPDELRPQRPARAACLRPGHLHARLAAMTSSIDSNPEDEYADDEYADHDVEDREQPSTPADIPDDEPEEDVLEQRQEVPYREDDR
jgi:hypothetical protein